MIDMQVSRLNAEESFHALKISNFSLTKEEIVLLYFLQVVSV